MDPILNLSVNLNAKPGVYALLVGSGISRAAKIPTGWEITLDLIRRLALANGENCDGSEASWFERKFGSTPDYSTLLKKLAPTSAAQQALLRGYFEDNADELDSDALKPTLAHRSIAQLVKRGVIRVIVTTNFDRLMERALEAEGIAPIVIGTPDAVKGAPPLTHCKCTVIKVNGDYLDARIRNSPEALAKYDAPTIKLISQVFDEYGLIISGWSSDYDTALRAALERSRTRRYPLYWNTYHHPSTSASALINLLGAETISGIDADGFFSQLSEKAAALEQFSKKSPVSTEAAVAEVKRYLSDPTKYIQYRELLITQAKIVREEISNLFHEADKNLTYENVSSLVQQMENSLETFSRVLCAATCYATGRYVAPISEALKLLAPIRAMSGNTAIIELRRYPLLWCSYIMGLTSVSSQNFEALSHFSKEHIVPWTNNELQTAPLVLIPHRVIDSDLAKKVLPNQANRRLPVNDHLAEKLKFLIEDLFLSEEAYLEVFDAFEYLWSLMHVDVVLTELGKPDPWVPSGAFLYRRIRHGEGKIQHDFAATSEAGLFGGDEVRLRSAMVYADPILAERAMHF